MMGSAEADYPSMREPALAALRGPGAVRRFIGSHGEPAPEGAPGLLDAGEAENRERTVD